MIVLTGESSLSPEQRVQKFDIIMPMASWAQKRRFIYSGTIIAVILIVAIYIVFSFVYKAPTCFDQIMNGNEQGIDCGGSCVKLCSSAFLPVTPTWTSFEKIAPGLYNVAAYIVNPNNEGAAVDVPYHFVLYDNKGQELIDSPGVVRIPPHRNTLAFQSSLSLSEAVPYKALFAFTGAPQWVKASDTLGSLQVTDKKYTEDDTANSSSLIVTLRNMSVNSLGKMSVYATLYDASSTIIGFSKTIVDGIAPQSSTFAPFTWPFSRHGSVISIEVLPVAE